MQASIAETTTFLGDCPHPLAKAGFVGPGRLVSHGHAAAADGFIRPPFAHPEFASATKASTAQSARIKKD